MTQSTSDTTTPQEESDELRLIERLPLIPLIKSLSIGAKLTIAFGILAFLMILVVLLGDLGSRSATDSINTTNDVRVPIALSSGRAQTHLLEMQAAVRGYLALGEQTNLNEYEAARLAFEAELAELRRLWLDETDVGHTQFQELEAVYAEWSLLPERLFDLRNDQLKREPALAMLINEGQPLITDINRNVNVIIEAQAQKEASPANTELLRDMAAFQSNFNQMISGLRGYVTSQRGSFKNEYNVNEFNNRSVWGRVTSRQAQLTPQQQESLNRISLAYDEFLALPPQMFAIVESERAREDLYLFSAEALPLANRMQELLGDLTGLQQEQLRTDLNRGRDGLEQAIQQTRLFGLVALIAGVVMAFIFRENITGPVRRLTHVAEQIGGGDLQATAQVESQDEIGILARTFNKMTAKLRATLIQVQREKKRADDLLHVVIPIGVDLSAEKNFNRLLEKMLLEAKTFCQAAVGVLYLRAADNMLKYEIVRSDLEQIAQGGTTGTAVTYPSLPLYLDNGEANKSHIATHAAVEAVTINALAGDADARYDLSRLMVESGLTKANVLAIPLTNSAGKAIGVMELSNPHNGGTGETAVFDNNLQQMMESFSSLAVAALEAYIREQSLRQEIQQLRIEIDETKRQQQVSEIVDTDFFSDLQAKAREMRKRNRT